MTENINEIFQGYFSSKIAIATFLKNLPNIHNRKIRIADIGGGNGYLLDQIKKFYQTKNCEVSCWIIDNNKEQLQLAPSDFHKVNKNCLQFFKENYFDIIIMRSVLQFLLCEKDKIRTLNNIYKSLKINGIFINQALFFEKPDNKIIAKAYQYFNRSLKIESLNELINTYSKSNFGNCKIKDFCPIMSIDNCDIQKRFSVDDVIINKISNLFKKNINRSHSIEIKNNNFQIDCNYIIMESKKRKF